MLSFVMVGWEVARADQDLLQYILGPCRYQPDQRDLCV